MNQKELQKVFLKDLENYHKYGLKFALDQIEKEHAKIEAKRKFTVIK